MEQNQLIVNRGSMLSFGVKWKQNGEFYTFKIGEKVRLKVMEKKNTANVVIQKDFIVENETEILPIVLFSEDTKVGELINRPVDYWYEIEFAPDTSYTQTIIGYKEEPAIFTLCPEGGEKK